MKYILIGGSGFIGQHFREILNDDLIANLDIDSGINNSDFINCNILNNSDLNSFTFNSDEDVTLIHLAAVHFDFQLQPLPAPHAAAPLASDHIPHVSDHDVSLPCGSATASGALRLLDTACVPVT